jgi:hypothetical protein
MSKYYLNPQSPGARSRRAPTIVTRLPDTVAVRYPVGGAR